MYEIMNRLDLLPSNRNFGITIGIVLILINLLLFYFYSIFFLLLLFVSFSFLILGIFNSFVLSPLNYIWIKLGVIMAKIFSPIFLTIFYFFIFTPYSIFGRFVSADIRNFKSLRAEKKNTYWKKNKNKHNFRRQY
jgi:hypothetical protein